jgi:hypothetical protein
VYILNYTKTHQTEFQLLIHKLQRKTLYMFSRNDRFLLQEPNKIGFAFFWFFYDFNDFSKLLQKTLKQLYSQALELIFQNYAEVPGLRKQPLKEW